MSPDEDTEMLDPPPPLIEYDPLLNEAASAPLSFASPSPFTQYVYPTTPLVLSESPPFPGAYYPNYRYYMCRELGSRRRSLKNLSTRVPRTLGTRLDGESTKKKTTWLRGNPLEQQSVLGCLLE
ncbi:hypothetical protein F5890DRAFT_1554757 [Lentinula detonsa]|uniref:Uncharacterized protein n=1 Tax=Lentinula detonsa TaxID=2804962 RepID=A0AA38PYU8_9AGAR|nr:hypothetical protein F5890DRAFT_1554757 [Lentinula detonsa]